MSARRPRAGGLAALLATISAGGCDYFAPPDPLELDPDVISIAMVLVAGESRADLLVGHPHRPPSHAPPQVTASLVGPGWRAAFNYTTDPAAGCGGGPTDWPIPMICLHAGLPEQILEGATYRLEGEGPKGSFTGEAVIPAPSLILDPGDTLRMLRPPDSAGWFRIPLRYSAPGDVGTLRPEMFGVLGDSTGTETGWIGIWPAALDVDRQSDTLVTYNDEARILRGSLHLLGIGWNYTRFTKASRTRFPWPSFGVSGEGVYGYVDGSSRSRPVHIIVEDP